MWRFRLLGDIALSNGGRQVRRLRANKYAFLLAYLCIHPGRAFSREELIELLWPDSDLEHGRLCLRTAMASLRRQLDAPDLFLEGARALVRVNGELIFTDVAEFEDALKRGAPDAASFYGGEFLPGCYDDWAIIERLRLEALYGEQSQAPRQEPPIAAIPAPEFQSSIPSPISRFCGRSREVDDALALVGKHRLVSLIGLGGMGKTRIAIETGRILRDSQRVFFLDLAKINDTFEVNGVSAGAMGIPRTPFETLDDRLTQALKQEETLLILDNFEHLLESGDGPEWARRKLEEIPLLKILTTSRFPLGLEGEQVLAVGPMPIEDAREMFLDRARSAQPDFRNSELLDPLCRRLDGMPLAIVLCAARASVLTAKTMLASLERRFEVLHSDRRNIDHRHGSLRAVLEWSCPVQDPLHTALSSLAVFAGSWTVEGASAVLGDSALDLLTELRQRSLIRVDASAEEHRFSMLDSVREYACETGCPESIAAAKAAHLAFHLELTDSLVELHSTDEWACFRGLDAEIANIFSAFRHGLLSAQERELDTLRVIHTAAWALWVRGYSRSLIELYGISETLLASSKPGEAQAMNLVFSAEAAGFRGEYELAIERLDKAADEFQALDLNGMVGECLKEASGYLLKLEEWDGAIDRLIRYVDTHKDVDLAARNIALASLASAYVLKGDFDNAYALYQDLGSFWRTRPNSDGHLAMIERGRSACLASTGRIEEAIPILEACVEVFRRMGLRFWEIESWEDLCRLYQSTGDDERSSLAQIELARIQLEG